MTSTTVQQLAAWCGGSVIQGDPATLISFISTDTRSLPAGAMFAALVGENFNGHQFVKAAAEKGAAAFLISLPLPPHPPGAIIMVNDPLIGLQDIARHYRQVWGKMVIGLTGSNGKTSTKDLTRAVLSQRFRVSATKGNLNNHIGLPLSVLDIGELDEIAVLEMGMNHPGEIAPLAAISAPNMAIVTNIGTAHIEFMGSREAIAKEKGVLAEAIPASGCVILNADDDFTPALAGRCRAQILRAGFAADADVRVSDAISNDSGSLFTLTLNGNSREVRFPVPGRHMIGNSALAAAAGSYLGLSLDEIVAGLQSAALNKGRLQVRRIGEFTFIDDSYNANPDSMRAALDTMQSFTCQGRRIAVLGRMGELGESSREEHLLLGKAAVDSAVDLLCAVGSNDAALIAEGAEHLIPTECFDTQSECAAFLADQLTPQDLVLIKGSRSAAMEKVIEHFESLKCSTGSTNS